MKTKLLTLSLLFVSLTCFSQVEVGYLTGMTKQGINPKHFQPIYGITLQRQFSKYINLESDFVYSQRMNSNKIQADYLQFMLTGKVGYFGNKIGVYGGYGFSLNPTVNHSNPENHTYVSFIPSVGTQLRILPKTILELKAIYDNGLMGAYYKNGDWHDYYGWMIMTTLKFQIK